MTRLTWTEREYETGVDRGVFFPGGKSGVAWNGLISVDEGVSERAVRTKYRDGRKYKNARGEDSFTASIKCFTYPDEFPDDLLTTRRRREFGFSYRVLTSDSYKIHVVYNAMAFMNSRSYTQNATVPFSFDISTRPVGLVYGRPTAHLIVDGRVAWPEALAAFEDILYGSDAANPRLPLPEEIFNVFDVHSRFTVADNGDGTFTVEGPDEAIEWIDATTFNIHWPQIIHYTEDTYTIHSW